MIAPIYMQLHTGSLHMIKTTWTCGTTEWKRLQLQLARLKIMHAAILQPMHECHIFAAKQNLHGESCRPNN